MTYLPSDTIRVFVSSRLGECRAERATAREAIELLGHQPVMFEGAGARPHAPRSVYLRGLEESQIFVGIYREGYGFIADDMAISGLEEEYRFAKSSGIPQLLYVLRGGEMEASLKALVDEFTGPDITIGYFDKSADLADRIREDLVALVSDYFSRGRLYDQIAPTEPSVVAAALVPPAGRLRRVKVETELDTQLEADPVALVTGPLGSGKTVFLSALSAERGWAFVECGEKSPHEVLADAANAVRALLVLPPKSFHLLTDAQSALKAVWQTSQSVTLVLDDIRHQDTLNLVRSIAVVSNTHRLILSSRTDVQTAAAVYEMPPLDLTETRVFVARNRNEPLRSGELVEIHNASAGNPLYLRYYLSGQPGEYANNLAEYETRVWGSLAASAQEILCYLAWSDRPLSLEDITQLYSGPSGSTAELAKKIATASSMLVQSDRGYALFHPHAKDTIQSLTSRSKPSLQFYIRRLVKLFSENREYVSAFSTLNSAGFNISANLLEMAGRQAAVKGDFRTAIEILKKQVDLARSSSDKTHERNLTLYLAQTVSLSGRPDEALELVNQAASIPADSDPPFDIFELKASIGALGMGDRQAFGQLASKQEDYRKNGNLWDAARLSVDLSAYHVRQNDPESGATEALFAMGVFREQGDDYGFRVARGNYLSAITTLPGKASERDKLIREMQHEKAEDAQQRALLCNVLARRAREKGDISGAKAFALEAIEIGKDIGDHAIVCNNRMNLGKSYSAEKNWELAIAQYEAADKLARESKLISAEAAAQELLASAFNRKGEGERAAHHANYAISVARGVSKAIESNAVEELAKAYELLNKGEDARSTWLRYGRLEIEQTNKVESGSYGFFRAVSVFASRDDVEGYVAAYRELFDVSSSKHEDLFLSEHLVADLPDLFHRISLDWTFELALHHARLMFQDVPDTLVRRIYMVSIQRLFDSGNSEIDALKRLRIALAFCMAMPQGTLGLSDIVDVGEIISRQHHNISFRANTDGSAHWTIKLSFGIPVIVSLSQVDDRSDVSLISLCIILVLVAFSRDIYEEVLAGISPKRSSANIQIMNYGEAHKILPLAQSGLVTEPDGCAVTRATDITSDASVPIVVITSDTVTSDWLPGSASVSGNYGRIMFGEVLAELVFHLQCGEIETESLYPKVAHLISKSIA